VPRQTLTPSDDLARDDGILARLDVDIGDTGGAVMDEQFGEFVVAGAKPVEGAIIAAHAAINAVLAAEIGNLDHRAEKHFAAKMVIGGFGGALVKLLLGLAARL